MSASDIDKGARWNANVARELEEARVGIICLAPDNLEAPWILFEAGALSKTIERTFVCPFLLDVDPSELKGPLVQFQATRAEKEDTRKLLQTINQALDKDSLPEQKVNKAFEKWWPELEERLQSTPKVKPSIPKRSDTDMLSEILELVRSQTKGESAPQWALDLISAREEAVSFSEITKTLKIPSMPPLDLNEVLPPTTKRRVQERIALKLREFAGTPLDQPLNPWKLAPFFKIRVMDLKAVGGLSEESRKLLLGDSGKSWSGGASRPLPDGWRLVFLNPNHTRERQAATLMEEICHVALDHSPSRHLITEETKQGIRLRNFDKDQEEIAYAVGAAALIPYRPLKDSVMSGLNSNDIARRFGISRNLVEYRIKVCRLWSEYKETRRKVETNEDKQGE